MTKWKRDLICGVILLIISISGFFYAGSFYKDFIKYGLAQPGNYLRLWLALLGILSLLLIIKALFAKDETFLGKSFNPLNLFSYIWLVIYIFALPHLGFLVSTPIFLTVLFLLCYFKMYKEKRDGKQLVIRFGILLLTAIIVTGAAYLLFTVVLSARLPAFTLF